MILKPIFSCPGYFASCNGEIYSTKPSRKHGNSPNEKVVSPHQLKKAARIDGRFFVNVYFLNGTHKPKLVSHLVAEAFLGKRPEKMNVCHGPLGKLVDSVDNLYYATQSQNNLDRVRDGTDRRGEKHPLSKFNNLQIRIIRKTYNLGKDCGVTQEYLSNIFHCSRGHISAILSGKCWSWLS